MFRAITLIGVVVAVVLSLIGTSVVGGFVCVVWGLILLASGVIGTLMLSELLEERRRWRDDVSD